MLESACSKQQMGSALDTRPTEVLEDKSACNPVGEESVWGKMQES